MMSKLWAGMVALAVLFGFINGKMGEVAAAAMEGAKEAVTLCLSIAGVICLWNGVMEILSQSGLADKLARLLRPALARLFPNAAGDSDSMNAISANITANVMGLGNAATPLGIKAAKSLAALSPLNGAAGDDLCMLVVINSASLQLIPATVASIRAGLGAAQPFDILPAVWLTSAAALVAGVASAKIFARLWKAGKTR